ncbi:MAG: alcohol dehydrogenase catalytic domain-containing protein [Deltaproteobacteria bacterium]|nr:alcohol dehydrogenase catalytic domain-containing protein [Deltaproteobacteria bacterium]
MKALQFNVTVPRFIAAKALAAFLGRRVFYQGPLRTVRLAEIPEPDPPGADWVKIRTLACGFCGSDLNLICLHDSPTASPFTSFPCVIGHEVVGEVVEAGPEAGEFAPGDRVAVNPTLSCQPRELSPLCPSCRAGRPGCCENFAEGTLPPGLFIGICRGLNGGFAPYLTAHASQLHRVPGELSLEAAVMTEPAAVAVQTVIDNPPATGEHVMVIGCGVIGNLIVQTLRAFAPPCHIAVIEPSPFAADLALDCGADEVIPVADVFHRTSHSTGARIYKPMLGKPIAMGGFHRIYDTVGRGATLNLSLRLLTAMGTLSVVGIGRDVKLDLTPTWLKLQPVRGVYAYGFTQWDGRQRHVFDIALEMIRRDEIRAADLVTHRFALEDYRRMIAVNIHKNRHRAIKTMVVFAE